MEKVLKNDRQYKNLEEFLKYLEKSNSDYPWISKDLVENPTLEQRLKFEICQQIIKCKLENNFSKERLSEIILYKENSSVESKIERIKKVLFCWIEEFSLEELTSYSNYLSLPIKASFEETDPIPPKWDDSLNEQKILEIVQTKFNKKIFEPLPEPLALWNEEVFFIETTYRGVSYRMIFLLKGSGITVRNIWVV